MKQLNRPAFYVTAICGLLGSLLLRWFFGLRDAGGLLPSFHVSEVLVLILSIVCLLFIIVSARKIPADSKVQFVRSPAAAVCLVLSGILLALYSVISFLGRRSGLTVMALIVGICGSICLFLLAKCRMSGEVPAFPVSLTVSVCTIFYTVYFVQGWGSDPQVITYLFPVLAALSVMLGAYHHAALSVKKSSVRSLQTWSQLALYCCLLALNSSGWIYFLAMALMMAADCISIREEQAV